VAETTGTPQVSKHEFSIAYDGTALVDTGDHSIDVQTLAPALLAFGRLIREANVEFNGKKSTAKVRVVSDFEHRCFNINFEVVLNLYEQIRTLLGAEPVKTAKEVLEWLGLLGIPTGVAGGLSYLLFLRLRAGRKISETKQLTDADQTGMVQVTFEGDHNAITVNNHIYTLAQNRKALQATRDAFLPVGQEGFDNVKVRHGDDTMEVIDWNQVTNIVKSCTIGIEESKEEPEPEIEVTPAWLSVYSPVFDPSAPMWRFRLGKEVIYADISQTDIASRAIERGGVGVEDAYQVRLEITTALDANGKRQESQYKILEVIRFISGEETPRQLPIPGV
jgi:hypothetical protein